MLLHEITLENFGAYKGSNPLTLSPKPGRPIILIGGLNGCGKTTLLDAIQLALYGSRARCSGRGARSYESFLRDSVNRQADPKAASVTLHFSVMIEGTERQYEVERSWKITGKSVPETLRVFIDGKHDKAVSTNWADYIEDLLPLEVASLFFFDGEKIESLADPERAAPVIESAVQSLLGVSTVEQLRTDLLALQRRQKVTQEYKDAREEIDRIESQLVQNEVARADAYQRIASIKLGLHQERKELATIEATFAKRGGELFRRRAELESQRSLASKRLDSLNETLAGSLAAGPLPLLLLSDQLKTLQDQVTREEEASRAKRVLDALKERDDALLSLLRSDASPDQLSRIVQYLDEDREKRAASTDVVRVLNMSASGIQQLNSLKHVIEAESIRARTLLAEVEELQEELEALDRQLAGVPAEEAIADLITQQDKARQRVNNLERELAAAQDVHDAHGRENEQLIAARDRAYSKYAKGIAETEHRERVVTYSDRARNTLEKFGELLLQRHINRLEVAVLESFKRLMRKEGLVQDLRIDTEKFTLTLIGADEDEINPARLSAGERQLLAVSLLWGLARVAGNRLPSVIDTPLGRLDSRHRQNLVQRYFPYASEQVLLLSTDKEIDDQLLQELIPAIARTYTLVHDDKTFTTKVENGYGWGKTQYVA
ncbi:DNA sulfur modification protein DndD [Planomonospora sp. ID82291]|uniref:DNA sulfur modification protein DndD n=1 Tax=Planomonospora sp. ID82291 TaxID=2738136 RepID=UPI0018C3B776|nr:DNA sulfur modification protein DndD [Planomonospora sp. ID82291]MBG0814641.1 DNA sulfur modification protein DndD [Planomonospora sp. ID82291]